MLGCIELLYVTISAEIAKNVLEKGWLRSGDQEHYMTHEVLDVRHARELFDIASRLAQTEKARREAINGMCLGAHYFWNLYLDMYKANKAME